MSGTTPQRVRVFLDANVLFAAAINPEGGASKLWTLPTVALVTCEQAVVEAWTNLGTVRSRDKQIHAVTCRARLTTLLGDVEIQPTALDRSSYLWCPWPLKDQNDVAILMGAINGECQYLLTSDAVCFGQYYGQMLNGVTVLQIGRFLLLLGVSRDPPRSPPDSH